MSGPYDQQGGHNGPPPGNGSGPGMGPPQGGHHGGGGSGGPPMGAPPGGPPQNMDPQALAHEVLHGNSTLVRHEVFP